MPFIQIKIKIKQTKRRDVLKKISFWSLIVSQTLFIISLPFDYKVVHYLNPLALIVLWACLTFLVYVLFHLVDKEPIEIRRNQWIMGFLIYTSCLIVLLFYRPAQNGLSSYNLIPFKTILFYLRDKSDPLVSFYNLAANILLFAPYGYLIMFLIKKRRFWLLIIIPVVSVSIIEIMQFVTKRGSLDIDDLILNVTGFVIGYLLYFPLKHILILDSFRKVCG
jgi:glycopeptide antibiotics resistance protein